MPFSTNLYFIALIPRRELREKINSFKQDFATRFNSNKALKVYPHITLKAPFRLVPADHEKLIQWFSHLDIGQKPFTIELKNFEAFHNRKNPVVYIHPIPNPSISRLQNKIMLGFVENISDMVDKSDLEFKPHVTVAYRDLSPEMFAKAWEEYKQKPFNETFEVDAFYLLQHDSKKWNVISTSNLK